MDGLSLMTSRWIDVCALEEVPIRGARRLEIGGQTVGVFRTTSGEVYAIENKCPHLGGPLSEGIVHDSAVTCPLHNWIIDLNTGQARGADEGCVARFDVEVRDARIFVNIPV
ncbi:MAG: nitrite reductase small subunit NirD [Pseudomonadota bacterium]